MSLASLPHELIAHIVGYLSSDAASLRACALTHPSFVPWTRVALFSTIRLNQRNLHQFTALVASASPGLLEHIRTLDIPTAPLRAGTTILTPSTLAKLTGLTRLKTHSDPFGFRQLSHTEQATLRKAVRGLKKVEIVVDKLYAIPYWATLLDSCAALDSLDVCVDSNGWGQWSKKDAELEFAPPHTTTGMRLESLCASGDVKVLTPLAGWLLPRHALDDVRSLELDVYYLHEDYGAPEDDRRPPLVCAAMGTVKELTLHLDPPMPLESSSFPPVTAASFPRLQTLHLRDGPDAEFTTSLDWLATFLTLPSSASASSNSTLETITLDHGILRRDLLAVPTSTWARLENALLGPEHAPDSTQPYSALRSLTLTNPHKFSYTHPDSVPVEVKQGFEDYVRGRLGRLGSLLRFGEDVYELHRRMWERGMVN